MTRIELAFVAIVGLFIIGAIALFSCMIYSAPQPSVHQIRAALLQDRHILEGVESVLRDAETPPRITYVQRDMDKLGKVEWLRVERGPLTGAFEATLHVSGNYWSDLTVSLWWLPDELATGVVSRAPEQIEGAGWHHLRGAWWLHVDR
ncbi:MAG: hypothetical protein AB7I19_14535 [Planctomycetota bacterium]